MTINVTPIPRLIDLAAPAFTLGTANAAGSAVTAVASDATLLVFDTTDPAAVAASAVVGTATTAPRRDHVHPGIVGAGTVVDNAIARFDGTSGDSLQGYSSNAPTISDAGVITLAAGQLIFPATQAASAGANDLDDYEEGTWTPLLEDTSHSDESQAADQQWGTYTKIGNRVFISMKMRMSSLGSMTTTDACYIGGLPFTSTSTSNSIMSLAVGGTSAFDNLSAGEGILATINENNAFISLRVNDVAVGSSVMLVSEFSANGALSIGGNYIV